MTTQPTEATNNALRDAILRAQRAEARAASLEDALMEAMRLIDRVTATGFLPGLLLSTVTVAEKARAAVEGTAR